MNLEPVLSQFTVEDLEDANMAQIHRNGLPRFRENNELQPEDDESTILLQEDLLEVEDMGEWLADAEATVERVSSPLTIDIVEEDDVSNAAKTNRCALAVLEVTKAQKTQEEKNADDCRGAEVCAVMMEVLGLEGDNGELKLTKEARKNLGHKNKVTDCTYNKYLQDYMDYCHN